SVKDTLDGVTTTLDSNLCASHTFTPVVNFPVQQGCKDHNNTATETPADVGLPESASATVTVCGPTGHTMGFWQNKNGQAIITGGTSTAGVCNSGTWLRSYNPFKDLSATASCAQVGTYVFNVIKLATCGLKDKTCNPMLKAQMLATALGVFFSNPALGGNQIGSPAPLGAMVVNLAAGGWKPAFGGANSMSVANMLAFAASQSNSGGSSWYGQVKATQVLASNAFDAINNSIAPVI
ncbi:MAG: hypothetical protein QOH13_74, partial [Thermoleophilaceae bacterium]|nr:hypothetical protein [Thermoleophilaceae bacterium]